MNTGRFSNEEVNPTSGLVNWMPHGTHNKVHCVAPLFKSFGIRDFVIRQQVARVLMNRNLSVPLLTFLHPFQNTATVLSRDEMPIFGAISF